VCWAVVLRTMSAARSLTRTLVRCDARRSMSNASSGPRQDCAIKMPLACSITGMLSRRACSLATVASWSRSRCGRGASSFRMMACSRILVSATLSRFDSTFRRTAAIRSASAARESSAVMRITATVLTPRIPREPGQRRAPPTGQQATRGSGGRPRASTAGPREGGRRLPNSVDRLGSRGRTRTCNLPVNSRTLCRLSYAGSAGTRPQAARRGASRSSSWLPQRRSGLVCAEA
jgi:hypothetical protein